MKNTILVFGFGLCFGVALMYGIGELCEIPKREAVAHVRGYTQGQIDYAEGKITVELQPQPAKWTEKVEE